MIELLLEFVAINLSDHLHLSGFAPPPSTSSVLESSSSVSVSAYRSRFSINDDPPTTWEGGPFAISYAARSLTSADVADLAQWTQQKNRPPTSTPPDYSAIAVLEDRGNGLDRTLEAVENVTGTGCYQFKALVILVATNFTSSHMKLLL
jgi:hypothetical protein